MAGRRVLSGEQSRSSFPSAVLMLAVLFSLTLSGCITVYRPLSGLHRPAALDVRQANFNGLSLLIQCLPSDVLSRGGAQDLCRKLQRLFENQGARVTTSTRLSRGEETEQDAESTVARADSTGTGGAGTGGAGTENAAPSQLTLRLTSKLIHRDVFNFLFFDVTNWFSFVQTVTLTDDTGFVLVREQLTARFEKELFGKRIGNDFSRDFYLQVSQLTLNANMRRQVLLGSASLSTK